jgi:hypothetical protein
MACIQALSELRSADWQLRRIECMLWCVNRNIAASNGDARRSDRLETFGANRANPPSIIKPPHGAHDDALALVYTATKSFPLIGEHGSVC